jgi:hypothetical protein
MTLKKVLTIADSSIFSGSTDKLRNLSKHFLTIGADSINVGESNFTDLTGSRKDDSLYFFVQTGANEGDFEDDTDWQRYLLGGTYKSKTYPGIFDFNKHYDHSTKINLPVSRQDIETTEEDYFEKYLAAYDITDPEYLEIARQRIRSQYEENIFAIPMYNEYYEKYQNYASTVESERLLPNFYSLYLPQFEGIENYLEEFMISLVSLEGTKSDIESIFPDGREEYMNFDYINHQFSDDIKTQVAKLENIFFTNEFLEILDTINDTTYSTVNPDTLDDSKKSYEFLPMCVHLKVEDVSDNEPIFKEFLQQNELQESGLQEKFLITLKDKFIDQRDTLEKLDFSVQTVLEGGVSSLEQDVELSCIDIEDMFETMLTNYKYPDRDFTVIGDNQHKREKLTDETGKYRFLNSILVDLCYKGFKGYKEDSISPLKNSFNDIFYKNLLINHNEVLGYRISKYVVNGTNEELVTNFWFLDRQKAINYFDSQVKYNKTYTYKFFQYAMIGGFSHEIESAFGTDYFNEIDGVYCLTRKDLITGNPVEQKIETTNRYQGSATVKVNRSIKIVEIPLHEKSVSVQEHPANMLKPTVSHIQNNENKISFFVNYEIFSSRTKTYPRVLTADEESYRDRYFNSYGFQSTDKLPFQSRSAPRYVEVFRLTKMPTSYDDFSGNIVRRIDLKFNKNNPPVRTFEFFERLNTNRKYYYTMRVLNENFVNGYLSPIYEVELVDDGGYIYSKIESYFENTLPSQSVQMPNETFGNFLLIRPTENNFSLDTGNVDFSDKAVNQLTNVKVGDGSENNVWGNKFKFRLISRKTGRKIDLNIDYKIDS